MATQYRHDETTGFFELHIQGILNRSEFTECEKLMTAMITAGGSPKVLVLLQEFTGWEAGQDWDNFDFMFAYGDQIGKIAIVGAADKQAEVKAFTGAGLRPTPVKFFSPEEVDDARQWLAE